HDQIGGGFCRYSVDERWEIPHFEKMLYDNAQLLSLYARRTAANARFGAVAHELVAWLVREMTTPDGAFFAALDADSEHEEGKFYVWRRDEIRGALSDREFAVAERRYGFDRPANFEGHAWNPLIAGSFADIAQALAIGVDEAESLGRSVRDKLFAARAVRVRPGLDDKVLTAWNALMIGALARTARRFDAPPLMDLAAGALDVLYNAAWRDGRLFAKAGADAAKFPAYLDDHAFLLAALLDCLRTRFHERDLAWAILIAEALLERFEDREHGGFHFTAHDHERLIQRPKPYADEAVPSGNGIAARALLALGHLVGEPRYLAAAERTLRAAWTTLADMPQACASLLRALADLGEPRTHVVVRAAAEEVAAWRSAIDDAHTERCDVYVVPPSTGRLPGALAAQPHARGGLAYVCRGTRCLAPIAEPAALAAALRARD
ncbi:MAG TPA: hypothetical protein VFB32_13745, partial [Rudaea sp.]|nr:hypothetical protein [Rudaea sp.]